ncbi:hypothetical protein IG611_09685 [Pectobacterium sp. A535-S3-A17]|uniref:hypothetical protein n=1 Tax=Pectobacterium quasiaquaticum TaxID=2774015 RepID=UPI0018740795|nr:hypothetical protein [Pectobacterium quasiaquaticum]MBE5212567.1 hypothetical protein [Pectobacterium quasiaquaticum]MBE5225627.1 hypothetical protein [Pectobacterium quasiaquaticum]
MTTSNKSRYIVFAILAPKHLRTGKITDKDIMDEIFIIFDSQNLKVHNAHINDEIAANNECYALNHPAPRYKLNPIPEKIEEMRNIIGITPYLADQISENETTHLDESYKVVIFDFLKGKYIPSAHKIFKQTHP